VEAMWKLCGRDPQALIDHMMSSFSRLTGYYRYASR
jgi:hypothetical protein